MVMRNTQWVSYNGEVTACLGKYIVKNIMLVHCRDKTIKGKRIKVDTERTKTIKITEKEQNRD